MFKVAKGMLHHIHIAPSENGGASVETYLRRPSKNGSPEDWNTEKHETVHTSDEDVAAHVKMCLKDHRGGTPGKQSRPSNGSGAAKMAASKVGRS